MCCVLFTQSCLTLCDPVDWSPPCSSTHGILQARILEWVAISSSRGGIPFSSKPPLIQETSFYGPFLLFDIIVEPIHILFPSWDCKLLEGQNQVLLIFVSLSIFYVLFSPCVFAKLLQLCLTLFDHMDYNPPGSSVHEVLQARILEWVAISSSRGSSRPGDRTHISYVFCIGRQILY